MKHEDDPKGFLLKILQTISAILVWMILQVFLGIFLGYGFFEGRPMIGNYIFYVQFIATMYFVFRYVKRKWA